MPNTGKPSPACHLCRERRVKCDLTRPGCSRCGKVGVDCPGYREEQDLLFHNQSKETYVVSRRKPRRRNGGSSSKPSQSDNSNGSPSPPPDQLWKAVWLTHTGIPPRIVEDWNTHCIPIVLHQFTTPKAGLFGYFNCLPNLYQEVDNNPQSCLGLASSSVAKTYMTNLADTPPNRIDDVQTYNRAIRATFVALEDGTERLKDSTLIAVWLLSVHELLTGSAEKSRTGLPPPSTWHMHSSGILSLLRARGAHQFATERGRNLFWVMYFFIQAHCLSTTEACPPESIAWFEILSEDCSQVGQLALQYSQSNYRICDLCSRIRVLLNLLQEISDIESYSILAEVDNLYNDISESPISTPSCLPTSFSPYIINIFRAGVIKLSRYTIMLIDRVLPPEYSTPDLALRRQAAVDAIHHYSREFLDTVPLLLGEPRIAGDNTPPRWGDGLKLLCPLIAVAWVNYGKVEHRKEALLILKRIWSEAQIGLALRCDPPASRFGF